jgi:hypothetical protein
MKISLRDLQGLYRAAISQHRPTSRRSCPSPNLIIGAFDRSLPKRRQARIINHLTHCGPCHQEFEVFRRLLRERDLCVEGLAAWADRQHRNRPGARVEDAREVYAPANRHEARGGRLRSGWRYALGPAILLACLVLVLSQLPFFKNFWENKYRAGPAPGILLIQPHSDRPIVRQTLVFQWTSRIQAEYYVLEIFDAALIPIWKSPEIRATRLILPSEISRKLLSSQPYYWLVTGALPDDHKTESEIGAFFVTDQ